MIPSIITPNVQTTRPVCRPGITDRSGPADWSVTQNLVYKTSVFTEKSMQNMQTGLQKNAKHTDRSVKTPDQSAIRNLSKYTKVDRSATHQTGL